MGDDEVRLVGVTAWGGAGKTALVTEWLTRFGGARRQRALRGLFAWNFYEEPSAEAWAAAVADWVEQTFEQPVIGDPNTKRVVAAARSLPLLLVLDGLEVVQEGHAGSQFGRLLDGTLRNALTQLCTGPGGGLVVLTSRFPFADLEQFDGGAARMLDVPPLTAGEGAVLLARSGGGWLSEVDRLELVRGVDGHALAVTALAGALADHPATGDIRDLMADLKRAGRTDARVARVLAFYAERLSDADQDLVALVSLFQRPVATEVILALGKNQTLGAPLGEWTSANVEAAVRQRLTGLLSWHPYQAVSAHPLVRDAFRHRLLSAASAQLVVDTALSDLPDTTVHSREEALRVVEMIELLLDANQWRAADELYRARTNNGILWRHLPAARLGERCASAFAGSPAREQQCREQLSVRRLSFYVDAIGLFAKHAGDMISAERFLRAACDIDRAQDDRRNLSISLGNLSETLWSLGDADSSRKAAEESVALANGEGNWPRDSRSYVLLAAASDLAGDTEAAERNFLIADLLTAPRNPDWIHLFSFAGCLGAEFLVRTGRAAIARRLTEGNREISERNGSNVDVARCDALLGQCDIADGEVAIAGRRLDQATAIFRDGDYLTEYAASLVDLAEQRWLCGWADDAEWQATQAIVLASPHGLVPTHAAALAARARARGDRYAAAGDADELERARDDAELSLRLATKTRRLPWQELDALEAHARLDRQEERDRGWADRASKQRAVMIPPNLDPDPLTTVEAAAAQQDKGQPRVSRISRIGFRPDRC